MTAPVTVRGAAVVLTALSVGVAMAGCRRDVAPPGPGASDAAAAPSSVASSSASASASASAQVEALVEKRCSGCHTGDLLAQQRLDASSWRKVVDRMQFWGAPLDPRAGENEKVTAFLAGRYGPDAGPWSMPIVTSEMLERDDEAALDAGPVAPDGGAGAALGLTPR